MKNQIKYGIPALALGLMLSGSVALAQGVTTDAPAGSTGTTTAAQPTPLQAAVGIAVYAVVLSALAFMVFERQDLTQA